MPCKQPEPVVAGDIVGAGAGGFGRTGSSKEELEGREREKRSGSSGLAGVQGGEGATHLAAICADIVMHKGSPSPDPRLSFCLSLSLFKWK
jgi:hypothetical protein